MAKSKIQDREDWLNRAALAINMLVIRENNVVAPTSYRIACGFPQGARKARCATMARKLSTDQTNEIFISPELDEPADILPRLTRQLILATHDCHAARAKRDCHRVGLAIVDGEHDKPHNRLVAQFERMATALGAYPHAKVDLSLRPKEKSRQAKIQCLVCTGVWRASVTQIKTMNHCCMCSNNDASTLQVTVGAANDPEREVVDLHTLKSR